MGEDRVKDKILITRKELSQIIADDLTSRAKELGAECEWYALRDAIAEALTKATIRLTIP